MARKPTSDGYDRALATELIDKIKGLKEEGYDLVARASKLNLPLVLGPEEGKDFNLAFHCAIAELSVCHDARDADLAIILKAHIDEKTMNSHFRDKKAKRLNLLTNSGTAYGPLIKRRIIGSTYPWFNQWMYLDFARITRPQQIDVKSFAGLAGRYRFFRSYPLPESKFQLSDGFLKIELDRTRNMIVFGQIARMFPGFEQWEIGRDNNLFEHRGFVIPNDFGNLSLISFREGVVRFGIMKPSGPDWSGTVLTSTKASGRPFAAKALIVKEGSNALFHARIEGRENFLDPDDANCKEARAQLARLNRKTMFENDWFMWGQPE